MMATEKVKRGLSAQLTAISLFTLFFCAPLVMAQSPTPSPAPANVANVAGADALTELVIVAGSLIPRVQEAIESPLVKGLENLAFWLSVIVMMFSFARLFRENDGASKDLFWWCFRLAIVFTLFGTGRTIINTWGQIGYDIVNVTEFRKVFWDAEIEFNSNYDKFTEGMFLVKATGTTEALAALTTNDVNLRNITSATNPAAWNLPNIFIGLTIGRAILQFSQIFLALLGAFITIALRLFAPFAIALAIDRSLAQRISYPFAWSAAVFTMVTPLVSHILGYIVYQVGNMALTIIKPESQIFTLATDGSISGDPNTVGPATAACIVLIVLMVVSSLLLLASPYISYKLAFGQIFEAVSATAAGWMGALTATGIEIAGITFGSALQRQASETRIEGQAQAEIARAMAGREASDLQTRAHKILGLQSASASRVQALGAISGGYAMALQMNEAQRQATTGLVEQSRQQQVVGILADRSFGQRSAGIQASREERDLLISQAQQNTSTLIHRTADVGEHAVTGIAKLGGDSLPLLPAAPYAMKIVTDVGRGAADISMNNTTTDAKVNSVRIAGQSQVENYESTTKMREYASDIYAERATSISNQQASANNAAARVNRDFAAGGVESAYRKQVQGVTQAYQLNLDANQINLGGALKAAEIMRSSGMKAVKLDQMSQIVSTLSRDLARRTEMAMSLRY
ncbi:MAG TPA: hypothetical protein VGB07_29145 [Blastocatellia bacterium]